MDFTAIGWDVHRRDAEFRYIQATMRAAEELLAAHSDAVQIWLDEAAKWRGVADLYEEWLTDRKEF